MFRKIKEIIHRKQKAKQEKKDEKKWINQKLNIIKPVKEFFSNRYLDFVTQILDEKYTEEEVLDYIYGEEKISYSIERVKKSKELKQVKEIYKSIVNEQNPLSNEFLQMAKKRLLAEKEELTRTVNWEAYEFEDIQIKNRKIAKLETRIKEIHALIELIITFKTKEKTKKRKRGRPSGEDELKQKIKNFMDGETIVVTPEEDRSVS